MITIVARILPRSQSSASVMRGIRAMASTTTPKCEWLVLCPDHPNVLEERMKIREQHLKDMSSKKGFFRMGAGMLEEPPREGESLRLNGSAFIAYASTKDEVLSELEKDVYTQGKVWDPAKVIPIKTAFREASA